ncbi:MAG: family 1 encapsulin nanocompartment shell protein [Microthrixaceae bacterium]|nr:bacteriocin family protein [Microthrixaceae bacterium]
MNHLHRRLAPISEAAWAELDAEAVAQLSNFLAARKLVEFHGPTGSQALSTGRRERITDGDVRIERVVTVPMYELRRAFTLARSEIESLERGAADVDLDPLHEAARGIAAAEDDLVFNGVDTVTKGLAEGSIHDSIEIPSDFTDYPTAVATAVANLRRGGVGGPFGLALGPRCYQGVIETTGGGIVVFDHLKKITGGPIVWAPSVSGAIVISMQGGDHHLEASEDLALGYLAHDADNVELYLTETIGFRLDGDNAAIALRHND